MVLIPINNYIEGVNRLVKFAKENLDNLFEEWKVILINNNSDDLTSKKLKDFSNDKNFIYVEQRVPKNLKLNFNLGLKIGHSYMNPTIISIWETDAVPNLKTFKALITVFLEERHNGAVSVSPMYKWSGSYCYPTHPHWHTDPIYKKHNIFGEITKVHAVPFVFSVWDPISMTRINGNETKDFCEFLQLCRDFGVLLSNEGKYHLRLKSYDIEHFGGGKKSRGEDKR